jgi:hypothetical protein
VAKIKNPFSGSKTPLMEKTVEERMMEKNRAQMQDYKRVFSSEQGKRVLSDLIANHFVMNTTFAKHHNDPKDVMAFREGQRQVVMRILTILQYEPLDVVSAIKESNDHVRKI